MSLSNISGGSATACAACKYQRKKCTKSCLLAPYFPQERQKDFLNAHRLFGVSNITKFIKGVEESQRDIAMNNLIVHANARALDPVGGLYKILCDLKRKVECYHAAINLVHQKIALCRSLSQQQQRQDLPFGCYPYGDLLQHDNEEYVNVDGYYHQNMEQHQQMHQQQQSPLNYEIFLEMPQQTSKVKFDEAEISDQEQKKSLEADTHVFVNHLEA